MQHRMFDAHTVPGGSLLDDAGSTAHSDTTIGGSTVGAHSTATGTATSVCMTRGGTANKKTRTVQNTLAKRGASVPQRLLGDLAAVAASASTSAATSAEGGPIGVQAPGRGRDESLRRLCASKALGVSGQWADSLGLPLLFGCVPFDAARDACALMQCAPPHVVHLLGAVSASLPCKEQGVAHALVCILHWLGGNWGGGGALGDAERAGR
jgi:hypothetical protein